MSTREVYFVIDDGSVDVRGVVLCQRKKSFRSIVDFRGPLTTKRMHPKWLKKEMGKMNVLVTTEDLPNSDSSLSGILAATHLQYPLMLLLTPSQRQILSMIASNGLAHLTELKVIGFSVHAVEFVDETLESLTDAIDVAYDGVKIPILYETETGDPDDMFAIAFLASRPEVELVALTVNPGTAYQVQIMRALCSELGISPLIGADCLKQSKTTSSFWLKLLDISDVSGQPDGSGTDVFLQCHDRYGPSLLVVTGSPIINFCNFLERYPDRQINLWVAQGGFAGDNCVPPEYRLPKFNGKITCPTFNFGGTRKIQIALNSPSIVKRMCVSKNVCHGVVYDGEVHMMRRKRGNQCLDFIHRGMEMYLSRHDGKKFHDPLACAVAIIEATTKEHFVEFAEVQIYKQRGHFGSSPCQGTNTFISIALPEQRRFWDFFWQVDG